MFAKKNMFELSQSFANCGLASILALAACGHVEERSHARKVINTDGRRAIEGRLAADLGDAIGSLAVNGTHRCMAYVSAVGTVKTAAHCLDAAGLTTATFISVSGISRAVEAVIRRDEGRDISVLSVPGLSDYLEEGVFDPTIAASAITRDTAAGDGFLIQEITDFGVNAPALPGLIGHTLDTEAGSSGTPLLQNGKVVAVHILAIPGQELNLAVTLESSDQASASPLANLPFDWRAFVEADKEPKKDPKDPTAKGSAAAKAIGNTGLAVGTQVVGAFRYIHAIEAGAAQARNKKPNKMPGCQDCHK